MNRFAVIDTETTGLGKTDRILEIGIVLVDGNEIVQEWETLINPERDIRIPGWPDFCCAQRCIRCKNAEI